MHHIGIDARLTYYRQGGISTYIRRLVRALEQQDKTNHYTVFHSRKDDDSLVRHFNRANLWTPCHHRIERMALSVELARHNLDLLHSPDFIPPWRGARHHLITIHDLNFLYYPEFLTHESRRYYNQQIDYAVRHADHILADSEATRQDLMNMLHVPPGKITVHLLGVDESFQPQPDEICQQVRQELDLPPTYILYVGTFEPRKNIGGLIEAYHHLLRNLPDAPPVVLAGRRGWLFDETMAKINSMNLSHRILWRENIPQSVMPALYSMASMLVLPSFYEGFGFPALEAMACGTIPIVSNRASLPEVVGEVGLRVEPDDTAALADAMQHALTMPEWRAQMQQAGRERAATFTWEQTARTTLAIYNTLL